MGQLLGIYASQWISYLLAAGVLRMFYGLPSSVMMEAATGLALLRIVAQHSIMSRVLSRWPVVLATNGTGFLLVIVLIGHHVPWFGVAVAAGIEVASELGIRYLLLSDADAMKNASSD